MTTYSTLAAQDLNNLYSSTLQDFSSEVEDQTFKEAPALKRLTANKRMSSGGLRIEKRISAGRNPNAKHLTSDADSVDLSDTSKLTVAVYEHAFLAVPVQRSLLSQSINSGPQQIVDLVKLDMVQASDTARDLLSTGLFGDGAGKTMVGLDAIVPSTTGNTYAGLSETTNPFWAPYLATSAGSFVSNGYLGSSDDLLTRAFLTCSDNGQRTPKMILSDRNVWEYYHRSLGQKVRYVDNSEFGEVGKTTLGFFDAAWEWDLQCQANTTYLLHPEFFEFVVDPNFNYKWLGPFSMNKQFLLSFDVLTLRYQMVVNRRNTLGRITGWSA